MTDDVDRFTDRVYLVTGVARGQGRAHTLALAERGAAIIGVDVCEPVGPVGYQPATPDDLAETVAAVEEVGGRILTRVVDVRDRPALDATVADGLAIFGRLDGVVANAGICSYGRLWELSDDQWDSVVGTNLTGVFNTLRVTVPVLLEAATDRDRTHDVAGSIVVTTSGAGVKPLPLLSHYSATKAGVIAMARSLAHELAPAGIRVNVVAPTAVRTPMGRDVSFRAAIDAHPEVTGAFGNLLPVGSVEPDEITTTVVWLLSDATRHVTGTVIPVDAGATIR